MRKPHGALIAMLMMTLSFATPAFAINLAPSVELASVSIPLEYAPADIEIVRVVDYERNEVRASVFEKSSGSIIESYSETPDIPLRTLESIQSSSDGEWSNCNMVMQKNSYHSQSKWEKRIHNSLGGSQYNRRSIMGSN